MKLTLLLLFLIVFTSIAADTYSQSTKLTLKLENVRIGDMLSRIESQSQFRFFYNEEINLDNEVSVNASDETLVNILDNAFKDKGISYEIIGRQIILTKSTDINNPSSQQHKSISGKVTDSSGGALPGVTILVKGTTSGIITDANGNYALANVPSAATLVFSFVGMKTQEIKIEGKTLVNVKLVEETVGLEEVVAVGYGTMKKGNLTGSVSTVRSNDLATVPMASTTNSLAGRLSGLVALQSGGQPGYDAATLSIRGFGDALIIVDGVEADFNSIDANQIESVSILKDGSAAIYGSRAGNGVILVTTKRGSNQKPTITYKSSYTLQGITAIPKPCSSAQYDEITREAWVNAGSTGTEPFTLAEIQKYYDGTDPQYPNTNWYNYLIRDWAPQQQHNLSVRGGSDKIKYYGFLGYMNQETIWKKSGGNYDRYNLQSNIDAKILDNLSLQFDIASIIEARKFPWRPMDANVWSDFWQTSSMYPTTLPDPTKISYAVGGGTGGAHVTTNRDISGYNDTNNQNIKGTISLNYTFKSIEGLSAKAFVNYLQDYSTNKNFQKPVDFYSYDIASNIYTLRGSLGTNSLGITKTQNRILTGQFSLNYDRTFGKNHHLSGLALYEVIDYYSDALFASRKNFLSSAIDQLFAGSTTGMESNGSASEMGRKSVIGKINYSFKNKYLIETILRTDASAKFSTNNKWGYFPSLSLGWRLSEENFMKKFATFDDLKLRASVGSSGNDDVVNFQYLSGYNLGTNATGGTYLLGSSTVQGVVSTGLANPYLSWEKIKVYNVGLDFSLWKRKLYGELDAFYRERSGIPSTRITSLPSTFGASLPQENINSLNNRGFELQLGTSGEIRGFGWNISGNISWTRAKWDHYEEPVYADKDQNRIYTVSGQWTDRQYGYISDGLFTSQEEIKALGYDQDTKGNTTLRPGDIKYKDINNDKIIDWKDQVEIGKGTIPHWMLGLNTNLKYKNFDLSVLFQGAMGYYNYVTLRHTSIPPEIFYNLRWTEKNNDPNAFIPRLGGANSNGWTSDHFYKKAGYLRLKTFTLGYNIPERWLNKLNIKQVRIYAAGTNLLTFNKLKKYDIDPESPSGMAGYYYPQQKTITLGVDLSL